MAQNTQYYSISTVFLAIRFLIMFEFPMITASSTFYGIEKENVTLKCCLLKHFSWNWYDTIVYTTSGGVNVNFSHSFGISNISNLVVYNFSIKYEGNYRCKGTDGKESYKKDYHLLLYENSSKPILYVNDRPDHLFQENDIVEFKCSIKEKFFHDAIMLSLFIDEKLLNKSFPVVENRYQLYQTFKHAIVKCSLTVRNRTITTAEQQIAMHWKPKVRLQMKPNENVPVGSLVRFECSISSNPVVDVTELCDASENCFKTTEHNNLTFIFQRHIAHQNQSGEYTCKAENTLGRGNATVMLTIKDFHEGSMYLHVPVMIVVTLLTCCLFIICMVFIAKKAVTGRLAFKPECKTENDEDNYCSDWR